jgi:Rieske Fe-S protein
LAAGVATAGVLTVGGVTLAQLMQNKQQSSAPLTNTATNHTTTNKPYHTTTTTTANKTTKGAAATNTKAAPAAQTKAAATPASAATQPPTATPAPAHTGTVLGYTSQAVNSSQNFTNPTDGQPSLLIRLPNGTFVASERACTHQQVLVNYDPVSQMIVCPAHGSVFDPANGFSRVSGPAMAPLKAVAIRMNADGTITTA